MHSISGVYDIVYDIIEIAKNLKKPHARVNFQEKKDDNQTFLWHLSQLSSTPITPKSHLKRSHYTDNA